MIPRTIGTDCKTQVHCNQQTSIGNTAYVWQNYRHEENQRIYKPCS